MHVASTYATASDGSVSQIVITQEWFTLECCQQADKSETRSRQQWQCSVGVLSGSAQWLCSVAVLSGSGQWVCRFTGGATPRPWGSGGVWLEPWDEASVETTLTTLWRFWQRFPPEDGSGAEPQSTTSKALPSGNSLHSHSFGTPLSHPGRWSLSSKISWQVASSAVLCCRVLCCVAACCC